MSAVSLVKVTEKKLIKQSILKSLDLINYKFPKNVHNVVIKPNMCYYWDYTTGQTTDPEFIKYLIEIIRENTNPDADISIVESDASAMKCKYAFPILGYKKLAEDTEIKLVNLTEEEGEKTSFSVNGKSYSITLPEIIKKADLKINVPKIKFITHTRVSCSLKNIFGCYPNPKKYRRHNCIDEFVVGLNKLMKFDLNILDGLVVAGNRPKKMDLIMSGIDPVSFDAAASNIAGVNPRNVRHIMLANKLGLGNIDYETRGEDIKYFIDKFPKKKTIDKVKAFGYVFLVKTKLLNTELY